MIENSQIVTLIRMDTNEIYRFQSINSFSSNSTSTITSYPTTEGTPRTDNIYSNPKTFSITIEIGGNENIIDEWGDGSNRPKTALSLLEYLKENAIQLTIITPQSTYTNMFLTAINPNSTTTNSYNLSAGLTFNELFISKLEQEKVGPFKDAIYTSNDSSTQENGTTNGENISDIFFDAVGDIGGGAIIGAGIGSIFGPVGSAVGAGIGVVAGAVKSCVEWFKKWF